MTRTVEPTQITQGECIAWTRTISNYSAADYDLQYRFRGQGGGFNVDATADGTAFDAEITATQSAAAAVAEYRWQAWITDKADATHTFAIQVGRLEIKHGFSEDATKAVDLRTPAKKALDDIDQALANAGSADILEYEISTPAGTRRVKRRADLLQMRKHWAGIVARENAIERVRNGAPFSKTVVARFTE